VVRASASESSDSADPVADRVKTVYKAASGKRSIFQDDVTELAELNPVADQFKTMYKAGSGKRLKWGIFQDDVTASELAEFENNPEAAQALREAATKSLTNIDGAERSRRYKAGAGAAVFCALLAAFQLSTGAPPAARALMALPLFFALGFTGSGASGL